MDIKRYVVKIGGESGQGINSVGEILAKSLKNTGYNVFGYREYPSLIKGGYSCYQIDFSDFKINSSSRYCNLLVCISRVSIYKYLRTLNLNGILIHNLKVLNFSEEDQKFISENNIRIHYVDTDRLVEQAGGRKIMANTVLLGMICELLDIKSEVVSAVLAQVIDKTPEILDMNLSCLRQGFEYLNSTGLKEISITFQKYPYTKKGYLISGNDALGLGSYAAGVRAYFAYPMTPSSSILTYLSGIKDQTKMLVRQVDDEITAAQMVVGCMFMGTRALTATSGGGFDLMTETISLSGITEIPSVFIVGQRPGPATGMPTWTAQGDLNLAIYSGHGEYPKCVIAVSNPKDAYSLIQHAFNIAEKYQIPVIVLTEKQIAESLFFVQEFDSKIEIYRGLESDYKKLVSTDRYAMAENGISKRWLPGQSEATFVGNSDEHLEDGSLTEESQPTINMYSKRMRKLDTLRRDLPEPIYYGNEDPEILIVGWGSTKNTVLDCMDLSTLKIGYLHYEYLFPLKVDTFIRLINKTDNVVIMENNYTSQLGNLLTQETGYIFKYKLLKYDGRPFFVEDLLEYIDTLNLRTTNVVKKLKLFLDLKA